MKKLKHTPGPWKYTRIDNLNHILIVKEGGDFPGGRNLIEIASVIIDSNARLISCAPEMLEALINNIKWQKLNHGAWDLNDVALIEKATGLSIEEVLNEN